MSCPSNYQCPSPANLPQDLLASSANFGNQIPGSCPNGNTLYTVFNNMTTSNGSSSFNVCAPQLDAAISAVNAVDPTKFTGAQCSLAGESNDYYQCSYTNSDSTSPVQSALVWTYNKPDN